MTPLVLEDRQRRRDAAAAPAPPFARVLCAVDGSPRSRAAVRQSLMLAGAPGLVNFVAVCDPWPNGGGVASLSRQRAEAALDEALALARQAGVRASGKLVLEHDVAEALHEETRGNDLLALGSHGHARADCGRLGLTAARVLPRAHVPVLIAREPRPDAALTHRLLVASDGSPEARRAVCVAAAIAHTSTAEILLVTVRRGEHPELRRELAREVAQLTAAGDRRAALLTANGSAPERIAAEARRTRATLVLLGSRGLTGLRALGSVSERVAERADCSVLIVRGGGGEANESGVVRPWRV